MEPGHSEMLERMRARRALQLRAYAITREIIVYCIYLLLVSTMAYDNQDVNANRAYEHFNSMFVYKTMDQVSYRHASELCKGQSEQCDQSNQIQVMLWPPHSPDLSQKGKLWDCLNI